MPTVNQNPDTTPDSYWFPCSRRVLPDAELFGVRMCKAFGRPIYYVSDRGGRRVLMKQIGSITVYPSGRIGLWPHKGITTDDQLFLVGAAEDAFRNRPSKRTGYAYRVAKKVRYWRAIVAVQADPATDAVAEAVRSAIDIEDTQDVTLTSLVEDAA